MSDELWTKVYSLLSPRVNTCRFDGARRPVPDRRCLGGIFFVLRTGCQWRALDATGLVAGSIAHDRFQQWRRQGFFRRLWQPILADYDELKGLDWSWLSVNGCQTKAPLARRECEPNPADRAKQGTKRSLLVEASGVPVAVFVAGGQPQRPQTARPHLGGASHRPPAAGHAAPAGRADASN